MGRWVVRCGCENGDHEGYYVDEHGNAVMSRREAHVFTDLDEARKVRRGLPAWFRVFRRVRVAAEHDAQGGKEAGR